MQVRKKTLRLWLGVLVFVVLGLSYFVRFRVSVTPGEIVYDRLLGILIFHSPFVLAGYVLIAGWLMWKGLGSRW